MKRGISFLQSLAICVLISGYLTAWIGIVGVLNLGAFVFSGGLLLLFYLIWFVAPKMLIGITKTSYGAAVGSVLAAYVGGAVIFLFIVLPLL
jgi:hypothetical protein